MGAMNGRHFIEVLARLPARVWLQAAVAMAGFIVLAILGFAVIAGVVAFILLAILAFKAKQWILGLFTGSRPPARRERKVIDVQYEIVERDDPDKR
jgi:hypothetical protein